MPADSLEGQNLDKYRVLEPLGRGGMARVYRAYHPQLDRYVAIKVLRSDLVEEEEFLARFSREARAVARLRHPNIVQVFDFDVRGDVYYMVMELLEGDTLRRRLDEFQARDERLPWAEMLRILLDVLAALAYAHGEGMIHRDVKPANVLLTRRGQAVLTDFGIAQIVGGTRYTVSGALMGTLSYMAPEQGLEGHCDARSDLYSLGIIFYEMLTGEPPFDAETPLAILMKHVNDPLPLPRLRNPDIPLPFERVVLKALAKRPGDRYQAAEEMAAALRQAAREAGVEPAASVSLPVSFSTPEAPSEEVAVLSGKDREKVRSAEFAADDTDARLGERLAAEQARAARPAAPLPPVPPAPAPRPALEAVPGRRKPAGGGEEISLSRAILTGVGLLLLSNLIAVWFGMVTGGWGAYQRGWPFELLLLGLLLSRLMRAAGSPWLFIPTGIILGNGYFLSFFALTEAWSWWIFLWPVELFVIAFPIWQAIHWSGQPDRGRQAVRRLAAVIWRPTLIVAAVVILLGTLFSS